MKKNYSKPEIYIEKFQMAQSIAACPGYKPGIGSTLGVAHHGSPETCVFTEAGGVTVFSTNLGCEVDSNTADLGCYNNLSSPLTIFGS